MPIPKPHDSESEKDFIARCMSNEVMLADYKDNEQRSGVCFSQWRNKEASMATKLSAKNKQTILQQALIQ